MLLEEYEKNLCYNGLPTWKAHNYYPPIRQLFLALSATFGGTSCILLDCSSAKSRWEDYKFTILGVFLLVLGIGGHYSLYATGHITQLLRFLQ